MAQLQFGLTGNFSELFPSQGKENAVTGSLPVTPQ